MLIAMAQPKVTVKVVTSGECMSSKCLSWLKPGIPIENFSADPPRLGDEAQLIATIHQASTLRLHGNFLP